MMSLDQLLSQLYPNRKVEELQKILDSDFNDPMLYPEYDTREWLEIKKEDLLLADVQIRLVKTLFSLQSSYTGVVDVIMQSFEDWTEGVIVFPDFPEETRVFLERYYGFLGWLNFPEITFERKMFLLDTRFLLLGIVWGIPVYYQTEQYFAKYIYLRSLRDDALVLAGGIARNRTILIAKEKGQTIEDWIKMFDEFEGSSLTNRLEEFMTEKIEVNRLSSEEKDILHKILTLYWGLKGGFIYREIEDVVPGSYQAKSEKDGKTVDDHYLDILYKANNDQIKQWLSTSGEAAYWMYLTKKTENFIKKLIYVLFEKIDLNDDEQAPLLLEFLALLQDLGLVGLEDILYYDENKQSFKWDDDAMLALRPEVEQVLPSKKINEVFLP